MVSIPDWTANARRHLANPQLVITDALDQLEATFNGTIDIVNPTNPYMHLIEAGAVNVSALFLEQEATNRRMYPSMSMSQEDLYLHMSNADYANRFAQPARTTFRLYLSQGEIYQRAVAVGNTGTRKIVIPRHTQFKVAEVTFTMQYPIEIRIGTHNALSVVYDTTKASPLQQLVSNIVPSATVIYNGETFLRIDIPVYQMTLQSQRFSLNRSQLAERTFGFTDAFHYARAFYTNSAGQWVEMITTHTDQVFDPNKPTAVLQVIGQNVQVRIPQVYLTTQMVDTEIRLDIYTTKGPLEMILSDYTDSQFEAKWLDMDAVSEEIYVAPLKAFNTYVLFSDETVVGGRTQLTLAELRERVITNSLGKVDVPITNVNIGSRLADMGYDMVLDIDNITNRQFLATRSLPEPIDGSTVSGAGCTMLTMTESMENLAQLSTVTDNGERITMLPSTLYQNINGLISIVPQTTIDSLNAMSIDVRARRINENNYLYSPFHYVLDMTNDRFEHRPYFLDAPSITSKSFVAENPTAVISVGVKSYQISRVPEGYLITLVLRSGQTWKDLEDSQVYCQLGFYPTGERNRAFQNGTLAGKTEAGERVYTFLIGTNYDLDVTDSLIVDTFQMFDDPVHTYACGLTTDFDVFFAIAQVAIEGFEPSTVDEDMGKNILPADALGLSQERLSVELGAAMQGLWAASRSVPSSQDYMRYAGDVPAVYENTIYKTDPQTGAWEWVVNDAGDVEFVVLHAKGSPMLDDQGNPVIRHYAGDVMMDVEGNPIVVSSRRMLRQVDLFLIDGAYWFATDAPTVDYREQVPGTIVGWLREDIALVQDALLEQTSLFLYPKATLGNINVKVMEDKTVSINSAQSFSVTFYLSGSQYRDAALRTALTNAAISVIHEQLQNSVVSISGIISALQLQVSGDSIAVQVSGLGGADGYDTVTLIDHSARLSIRKKAVAKADGTIGVEDDVMVAFVQHSST
ncbi:virion structural protein [Xanthomonas phage RTH11]|nr:virion structural protein [Xanthomonas phage RTH11]